MHGWNIFCQEQGPLYFVLDTMSENQPLQLLLCKLPLDHPMLYILPSFLFAKSLLDREAAF